jgi:cell division transport system permease protein
MITFWRRTLNFGWRSFLSNKEASSVATLIVAIVILLASFLFSFQGASQALVTQVREQVSLAAYFTRDTSPGEIENIKDQAKLEFPEVIQEIKYISSAEAWEDFTIMHKGDLIYQQALEQIGENPFRASLDIQVKEEGQYQVVANYLSDNFGGLIYKIDYFNRQEVIKKIFAITARINLIGGIIGVLLLVLIVLIAFSAVRLAIRSMESEIEIMKLVGASNWFTRMPFIIQGVLYGLFGMILANLVLFALIYFFGPRLQAILPNYNAWIYLKQNLLSLISIQLIAGVGTGVVSTFLAVRKYLK